MHPCVDPVSMAATALPGSVPGPIDRRGFARQALLSGVAVVAAAAAAAWVAATEADLAELGHAVFTYAVVDSRGMNFPLAMVH